MKHFFYLYFVLITGISASCLRPAGSHGGVTYTMRDYLQLAAYNRQAEKEFQATGKARHPYIIEISRGNKHLTFIGSSHTREITRQADSIDRVFRKQRPQVAINEGGPDKQIYASRNEAIEKNGEIGQLKYLCDSVGIPMINGDLDLASEVKALFEKHGRKNVLLYLAHERFLDLYVHNWIDTSGGLEKSYQKEFVDYLQNNGVELKKEEKHFSYIRQAYQDYFREPFDIRTIPAEKFYFLHDAGELTRIGRSSKVVRDIGLLGKIEEALKSYDRVFIVFGGAHAWAIEPALHQIMGKQKTNKGL